MKKLELALKSGIIGSLSLLTLGAGLVILGMANENRDLYNCGRNLYFYEMWPFFVLTSSKIVSDYLYSSK